MIEAKYSIEFGDSSRAGRDALKTCFGQWEIIVQTRHDTCNIQESGSDRRQRISIDLPVAPWFFRLIYDVIRAADLSIISIGD
jgi:hypothetical protein